MSSVPKYIVERSVWCEGGMKQSSGHCILLNRFSIADNGRKHKLLGGARDKQIAVLTSWLGRWIRLHIAWRTRRQFPAQDRRNRSSRTHPEAHKSTTAQ